LRERKGYIASKASERKTTQYPIRGGCIRDLIRVKVRKASFNTQAVCSCVDDHVALSVVLWEIAENVAMQISHPREVLATGHPQDSPANLNGGQPT
jgi:hypothetical protein